MTIPFWLRQAAVILGSTAAGGGLGYGVVCLSIPAINRHLSATLAAGQDTDGVGGIAGVLASAGYNIGQIALVVLGAGVMMIIAIMGGLTVGLSLSGRLTNHNEGETETL